MTLLPKTPPPVCASPVPSVSALLRCRAPAASHALTYAARRGSRARSPTSRARPRATATSTLKDAVRAGDVRVLPRARELVPFALRRRAGSRSPRAAAIYEARGEFQLTVDAVRLAGAGALYERFARLKATLEAAGLGPPPEAQAGAAAIPAGDRDRHFAGGAALRRRAHDAATAWPAVRLIVYPSSSRATRAPARSPPAIGTANARRAIDLHRLFLIVCRGGGSIEDLWAFNEERVARAALESRLPVVSGVGHETDFTICDFVADVARRHRPPRRSSSRRTARVELDAELRSRFAHLRAALGRQLERALQRADYAGHRLQHPATRLRAQRLKLDDLARRMHRRWVARSAALARRLPRRGLWRAAAQRSWPQQRTAPSSNHWCARVGPAGAVARRTRPFAVALEALNPEAVVERGYAIVTDSNDAIVQDSAALAQGDTLRVRFARGTAAAEVTAVGARHASGRTPGSASSVSYRHRRAPAASGDHFSRRLRGDPRRRLSYVRRSARDAAARGRSASAPSSLRRSASRGCRRTGSWRPCVSIDRRRPAMSIVWRVKRMLDVGLTATTTTMSWPVEIPPRMPPALLGRKPSGVISSRVLGAFLRDGREARADLDALDRVDAHHVVREIGVELVVHRLAPAHRHASTRPS